MTDSHYHVLSVTSDGNNVTDKAKQVCIVKILKFNTGTD